MSFVKKLTEALKHGFRSLLPTCRDATRLQSEALDTQLSPAKRVGLSMHLLVCKWCRRYGQQIVFLRNAAHEHPDEMTESVPQKLSDAARERIKRKLHAEKE